MKAPTASRRRVRGSVSTAPIPAGLQYAFKLIATDECSSRESRDYAERAYPVALRIINALHGQHAAGDGSDSTGRAIETELVAVAATFYEESAAEIPGVAAEAGFQVGFAVCWLMLRDINGGAR